MKQFKKYLFQLKLKIVSNETCKKKYLFQLKRFVTINFGAKIQIANKQLTKVNKQLLKSEQTAKNVNKYIAEIVFLNDFQTL